MQPRGKMGGRGRKKRTGKAKVKKNNNNLKVNTENPVLIAEERRKRVSLVIR